MKTLGYVFLLIVLTIMIIGITSWVFMYVWNWVMPLVFSLPEISYWTSVGLYILVILIRGSNLPRKSIDNMNI